MAPTLSSLVLKIQIGEDEEHEKVIKLLVALCATNNVAKELLSYYENKQVFLQLMKNSW
jgi:hypothetical protein